MPRTKNSVQTKRKQRKARGGDLNGVPPTGVSTTHSAETRQPEGTALPEGTAPPATKPWWMFWAGKGRKSRKNHKKSVKGKSKK